MTGTSEGRLADTLAGLVDVRVVDLGQPLDDGIPTSPSHPGYRRMLMRRHGDAIRVDGTSGANDLLVVGTHTGTHVDAIAHVSHAGLLHDGSVATEAQLGGRFETLGVHAIPPTVCPAHLLDIAAVQGVPRMLPGEPIGAAVLQRAADALEVAIAPGDAILIRTGWGASWSDAEAFLSHDAGVPGVDEEGARWLADQRPALVGSDTTAFEWIPAGAGHAQLPGHRVLIVEHGIPIVEMLQLEHLAATSATYCTLVLLPLPLVGATGSPVRPIAILPATAGSQR